MASDAIFNKKKLTLVHRDLNLILIIIINGTLIILDLVNNTSPILTYIPGNLLREKLYSRSIRQLYDLQKDI